MDIAEYPNEIKKNKTYFQQSMGNHLLVTALAPASGTVYFVPIESAGDFVTDTYEYWYGWSLLVPGGVGAFEFFCGLYRMERGTGGTAATVVLADGAPLGSSTQGPSLVNASGSEYQPQATVNPGGEVFKDGIYFIGMLWVDTSTAPARATWQVRGTVLPNATDYLYYRGSTGNTVLPATDTLTTSNAGQIYCSTICT
jgi:hypothetical protein